VPAPATPTDTPLRIGQLARVTGFTPGTLRYYEAVGLLRPAARTTAGYRLYSRDAVERLRFVRRAQGLGISLADICAILRVTDAGAIPCEHMMAIVEREIARIEAEMRRLKDLHQELACLRTRLRQTIASGVIEPGEPCPCFENAAISSPKQGGATP